MIVINLFDMLGFAMLGFAFVVLWIVFILWGAKGRK